MTVDEFIDMQSARLEDFRKKWKEKSISNSEEFVIDQEWGAWFEDLYWFNANSNDLNDRGLND